MCVCAIVDFRLSVCRLLLRLFPCTVRNEYVNRWLKQISAHFMWAEMCAHILFSACVLHFTFLLVSPCDLDLFGPLFCSLFFCRAERKVERCLFLLVFDQFCSYCLFWKLQFKIGEEGRCVHSSFSMHCFCRSKMNSPCDLFRFIRMNIVFVRFIAMEMMVFSCAIDSARCVFYFQPDFE